jgi:hypothetical protein
MAIAVIIETQGTPEDYQRVGQELREQGEPAAGMLTHIGMQAETGVRIVEVWESQEAYDTFVRDRLGPTLQRLGLSTSSAPAPQVYPVIYNVSFSNVST